MQNISPVDMEQTDDATTATLNAVNGGKNEKL